MLRKSRPAIHTRKTFYFPTYIFSWICLFSITCQSALPINLVLRWWQEKSYDNQSSVAIIQVLPLVKIFSSLNFVLNLENLEQNRLIIIMESKRSKYVCKMTSILCIFIYFFINGNVIFLQAYWKIVIMTTLKCPAGCMLNMRFKECYQSTIKGILRVSISIPRRTNINWHKHFT